MPLSTHWDGNLPILLSGQDVDQHFPNLASDACASTSLQSINFGLKGDVCILLEQKMEKYVLWIACGPHIMEIMLEAVISQTLDPSSGSEIVIYILELPGLILIRISAVQFLQTVTT